MEATPILTPMADELGIRVPSNVNYLEFKQGWDDYNIKSTPTIVQFKNGEEVSRIVGLQEEGASHSWLTDNHVGGQ